MVAVPVPPVPKAPTYADIEALPPHVVGEILNGELVVSPRPRPRHARVTSYLGALLVPPYALGRGGPGGWIILDEPELSLPNGGLPAPAGLSTADRRFDPVVPDLAGWRLTTMPDLPTTAQFHIRPDWICEVLSPSTARRDRMLKLPFYARAGVGHCWLIDPDQELVEVFENLGSQWKLVGVYGGRETVSLAPFDEAPLELGLLWGPAETETEPPTTEPDER